jgi:1-acyl-sn-glycerol-3-phosphate acyltransferase
MSSVTEKSGESSKRITIEDAQKRLEQMRRWVRGPFNQFLSFAIQAVVAFVGMVYMRVLNRTKVYGQAKLRLEKPPFLYVSNHLTMIDDFLMDPILFGPIALSRFSLKYFPWHVPEEKNFFLNPFLAWLLQKCQSIPITRGRGVFQPGMMRVKELLLDERIIHIYPEGTRSRSGDIGRGQIGVGKLAFETKMKVVPVYHEGIQNILPVGTKKLQFGKKIAMVVGEPVSMSDLYEKSGSKEVFQDVANRMVDEIRKLRLSLHDKGQNAIDIPKEWLDRDRENLQVAPA